MILTLLLITLTTQAEPIAKPEDPAAGTRVSLDFRNSTIPQVVQALAARSGNAIELQNGFVNGVNEDPSPRRVSLEAKEPVLFWEALDRLCREQNLRADLINRGGLFTRPQLQIVNLPSGDEGMIHYVGPLRISQFRLHAAYEVNYGGARKDPFANDRDPFYAEFRVQVEPRVVVASLENPRGILAEDDLGQSLAKAEDAPANSSRAKPQMLNGQGVLIHVPLSRPKQAGQAMRKLSGVLPMEIAIIPKQADLVVPLSQAGGKTFRVGEVMVEVQESQPLPNNAFRVKLTAKVVASSEKAKDPTAAVSRRQRGAGLARQIEIVDADGGMATGNGSMSHGETMTLDMTFFSPQPGRAPKELRIYSPAYAQWDAPFTFTDVPLP